VKVAFQGKRGAISESAIYSFFPPSIEVKPCRNLAKVFESVTGGETQYGVVPVENSIEGSINQTYDLFLTHDLKVCGEIIIRIVHCLIAHSKTELNSIKTVYSHPQALAQCRNYLESMGFKFMSTFDIAGSVKMIKENKMMDAAAIASERAAEIYGMKALAKGIEDNPNNYTRFFVLSKHDSPPSGMDKTSIIFSVKHVPGALYQILEEFANRNINLTKLESRPTKKRPWEYNFYLDFEGHRSERKSREVLTGIKKKSTFVKILGSYSKTSKLLEK